jgi:hypothetical protein
LIGGGLVLFGVGTGSGGTGVLSQLANQATGSATGVKIDETAVAKAHRAAKAAPSSTLAWDRYARSVFVLADTNYVTSENGFTPAGAQELSVLKSAWNHYVSLNPPKPDASLASEVAFAFGPRGTAEYPVAESAQEVLALSQNTAAAYYGLAAYAYLAHDTDHAQIAEAKALALAPKKQQATIKTSLAQIEAQASGATGTSGTTGTSG